MTKAYERVLNLSNAMAGSTIFFSAYLVVEGLGKEIVYGQNGTVTYFEMQKFSAGTWGICPQYPKG